MISVKRHLAIGLSTGFHKTRLLMIFLSAAAIVLLVLVAGQQLLLNFLDFEDKTSENRATAYLDQINNLIHQDQYLINEKQQLEIKNVHDTVGKAALSYEELVKLREMTLLAAS